MENFSDTEEAIARKRDQVAEQMSKLEETLCNDSTCSVEDGRVIVALSTSELLKKLKDGELTAMSVLRAFQRKALEVNKQINCITEFIPQAEEWAEALDRLPSEKRGLLHGVPVSLKENIDIKGLDSTMGLVKHLNNPASTHAVLVQALLNNGAVPFCKTNVPQVMLSYCCSNPIFGMTNNPHSMSRTPGGSSGGEGALIASGASVLGVGSDFGGSVRNPASFCGIAAIKPTQHRLSGEGFQKALSGAVGVVSSPGILGRDVNIIKTCMEALTSNQGAMSNLDCTVTPIPWNENILNSKQRLKFGYFDSLDYFPCTPGVKRAVQESRLALHKAGHFLVAFELFENPSTTYEEILSLSFADAGKTMKTHLENEPVDNAVESGIGYLRHSFWKKMLIKLYGFMVRGSTYNMHDMYHYSYDLWQGLIRREKYIQQFSKQMKENNIDLLLTPAYALPAPQQYVPTKLPRAVFYTAIFNYLNFPSGTVPVTKENEEDQKLLEAEYLEDELEYRIVKEATRGAKGLPLGVLISGLPWQEELVCRGMAELENALKDYYK